MLDLLNRIYMYMYCIVACGKVTSERAFQTGTCRAVTQKGRTIKLQDKISLIHIPEVLF